MNIGRIKALSWITVLALGSYLGWDVYQFVTVGKGMLKNISTEEQKAILNDVPEVKLEQRRLVPYPSVLAIFHNLNWTGLQTVVVDVPGPTPPDPVKQPDKAVSELLTVVLINYSSDSRFSNAYVHYRASADERKMVATPEDVLFEGDQLPGKYKFITLSSIQPEYVEFTFEVADGEEPREPERMLPPEYQSTDGLGVGIARLGDDGILLEPENESLIQISANREPVSILKTHEVRTGQFRIGTEDAAVFGRDYSRIFSSEVRTGRYRDPNTNRYSGIIVHGISPGSIVNSHGLKTGDIIKSINGDPVTSTQEAISYVKTNADVTSHWVAIVERQGKDITLTYDYTPTN